MAKFMYLSSLLMKMTLEAAAIILLRRMQLVPLQFTVPFKCNDGSDRLYSKFVLAVKENGAYKAVSEHHYITNPEVVAKNTDAFKEPLTKKGLNIELNMLDDAFDLGVKYVTTILQYPD